MKVTRREVLKNLSLATAGLTMLKPLTTFAAENKKIRIALIGVGLRGQMHLKLALRRKDVEVVAICDVDPGMLQTSKTSLKNQEPQC